jgi:hypothetical protein
MKNIEQRAMLAGVVSLLIIMMTSAVVVGAQEKPTAYPRMAPLEQYLMTDRASEIALARSAAPEAISSKAKVLVLGRHGYETAVAGENGFVCVVERAWMSGFDAPQFWNPKLRGPICFNPPAARTILPITLKRTEMVLRGLSKTQIEEGMKKAFGTKELARVAPGAMSYMMSKQAYLTNEDDHNLAHLMFYTPLMQGAAWGADLPNSPVMLLPQFKGAPEPIDVFIIPVGRWSDGTSAPTT